MKTRPPQLRAVISLQHLAERAMRDLRADPSFWINVVLGILGWIYVFVLYWNGQGLGSKLPAYAAF